MADLVDIFRIEQYRLNKLRRDYDPVRELKKALRSKKKIDPLQEKWNKILKDHNL